MRQRHAHAALVAEIRQDAQADPSAGDRSDAIGHGLGDRVDEVGPHGVAAVDDHVDDNHVGGEHAHLDPARPSAARDQPTYRAVGQREDLSAAPPARASLPRSHRRTSRSCTCAIMSGGSASAVKPPPSRTIFAAFDAAATTLGSSMTIGHDVVACR